MPEMQEKESLKERRERYETAFLEYLMENDACGTSIEDWAAEHGLSLELLLKTGRNNGFDIPRGKSVRKQREDFSSSFEPVTVDTEISPVVKRERLKEDERKRTLKEKTAAGPQEETPPAPAPRKRGRPRKIRTPEEKTAKTTAPMQHGKEKKMTLQEALKEARAIEQNGILYLIADSPEQLKTLEENRAQSMEIARNATGFKGAIEIVSSLPDKKEEEKTAAEPQEEKTLKEEKKEEAMPEEKNAEGKKPSFMMMDGKAVLECGEFHMEVELDMASAADIKGKVDLLYSALERFTAIGG